MVAAMRGRLGRIVMMAALPAAKFLDHERPNDKDCSWL